MLVSVNLKLNTVWSLAFFAFFLFFSGLNKTEEEQNGGGEGVLSFLPIPSPLKFSFSFSSFLHSCLRRKILEDEIRMFLLPFAYSV